MSVNYCLNGEPASEPGADVHPQQSTSKAFENLFQKWTPVMCTVTRQKFQIKPEIVQYLFIQMCRDNALTLLIF